MKGKQSEKFTPRLAYQADPIRESLKVLGSKWTLLILRDVAFLKLQRFGQIRRNNQGLTPRVLSRRLHQMTTQGLLERRERDSEVSYHLTSKGEDAIFILLAILRYGIRHHLGSKAPYVEEKVLRELHYTSPFSKSKVSR